MCYILHLEQFRGILGFSFGGGLLCLHCSLPPGIYSVWLKPPPSWRTAKSFARRNKWDAFSGLGRLRTDHRTRTKESKPEPAAIITQYTAGGRTQHIHICTVYVQFFFFNYSRLFWKMKQWVKFSAVTGKLTSHPPNWVQGPTTSVHMQLQLPGLFPSRAASLSRWNSCSLSFGQCPNVQGGNQRTVIQEMHSGQWLCQNLPCLDNEQ